MSGNNHRAYILMFLACFLDVNIQPADFSGALQPEGIPDDGSFVRGV